MQLDWSSTAWLPGVVTQVRWLRSAAGPGYAPVPRRLSIPANAQPSLPKPFSGPTPTVEATPVFARRSAWPHAGKCAPADHRRIARRGRKAGADSRSRVSPRRATVHAAQARLTGCLHLSIATRQRCPVKVADDDTSVRGAPGDACQMEYKGVAWILPFSSPFQGI